MWTKFENEGLSKTFHNKEPLLLPGNGMKINFMVKCSAWAEISLYSTNLTLSYMFKTSLPLPAIKFMFVK